MSPAIQGWTTALLAWQQMANDMPDGADQALGIVGMIFAVIFYLVLFAAVIALVVFVYYILYTSLTRIPPQFRQMEPGQVFLLLIPFFNFYWIFVVYSKIPQSFQAYFRSIGRTEFGDCGEQLGLWTAIAVLVSAIPCVNCLVGPVGTIMTLIAIFKFKALRDQIPLPAKF